MTGDDTPAADVLDLGPAAPGRCATIPPETVGLKAHGLIRIAQAGLPVPPGFVLSTRLCRRYHRDGRQALADAVALARRRISALEVQTGRSFGGARRPLLVSVRSGAAVSMPGMLDTILDVGLNEESVRGLIRMTGDPRFARDWLRRFIQQFAQVVHGCAARPFDEVIDADCGPRASRACAIWTLLRRSGSCTSSFTGTVCSPGSPLRMIPIGNWRRRSRRSCGHG